MTRLVYLTAREIAGIGLILLATTAASAETLRVCWDGSALYSNLGEAIGATKPDALNEIVVCPGTYSGPGNNELSFLHKAIVLRSEEGADSTIIDCQGAWAGFDFRGEDPRSVVDGFTVIDCDYGVHCVGSSLTIRNCIVTRNTYGIVCENCSPTITDCVIADNGASYPGGGISCDESDGTITNCIITGNSNVLGGGGIRSRRSRLVITNCAISQNRAIFDPQQQFPCFIRYGGGGGIYTDRSATITDCTITGNSADAGGGVYVEGTAEISNCVITGNSGVWGGGLYIETSEHRIARCTITENSADWGGGIHSCSGNPKLLGGMVADNVATTAGNDIFIYREPDPCGLGLLGPSSVMFFGLALMRVNRHRQERSAYRSWRLRRTGLLWREGCL